MDPLPVLSQMDREYPNSEPCFVFLLTLCSALLTVSHLKTLFYLAHSSSLHKEGTIKGNPSHPFQAFTMKTFPVGKSSQVTVNLRLLLHDGMQPVSG